MNEGIQGETKNRQCTHVGSDMASVDLINTYLFSRLDESGIADKKAVSESRTTLSKASKGRGEVTESLLGKYWAACYSS